MRDSVARAFLPFTEPLEGHLSFMYLDSHDPDGLVTTGIGNLIDPIGAALALPWQERDGSPASQARIAEVWNLVKSRQDMKRGGGVAYGSLPGNDLRLSEQAVQDLVLGKLVQNENTLRADFPGWDVWPSDAQLALLSMVWAMGAKFNFPAFRRAATQGSIPDFATMARESHMSNGAPARNDANRQMFENAARVVAENLDPEPLRFPISGSTAAFALTGGVGTAAGAATANFLAANPDSALPTVFAIGLLGGASWCGYKIAMKRKWAPALALDKKLRGIVK